MTETTPSSAEDRALDALTAVIQAASNPEAVEAQTLLLRRLALDGDLIPTRVPAPLNVTESGGYFNLLETLGQRQTLLDVVAGALGIASGSARALAPGPTLLGFTSLANDRPEGDAGPTAPGSVLVRSDLAGGVVAARDAVHAFGAVLPLWSPPLAPDLSTASDDLEAIGRRLRLLPTAALADPLTDSLVLAHEPASPFTVWARPDAAAAPTATLPDVTVETAALDPDTGEPVLGSLGPTKLVSVAPILAAQGWVTTPVDAAPTTPADTAWASLVCVAGLLPGVTRLRDELALLYPADRIGDSPFAARLDLVWNGTEFASA
ncbi:hypothetical protein SAMN04487968_105103 [Nocardioides terrae]|uniref:Uncharacterized protein n=1 Tax=Nocardioides terrae TaxID=574651 RepID=A0A1I1I2W0_9ACTN|nr:hypothetical protein [Nocardioides terrae]SFC30421.1 hypothetical protein SAMN04487968_105103 [Nocardioides terrae]